VHAVVHDRADRDRAGLRVRYGTAQHDQALHGAASRPDSKRGRCRRGGRGARSARAPGWRQHSTAFVV